MSLFYIESLKWSSSGMQSTQFEVFLFYVLHGLVLILRNMIGQTALHLNIKSQKFFF